MSKLKTILLIISSFLLLTATAMAQFTTVTGTFQDPNGQAFINGTYTITFVPVSGQQGPYTYNGTAINTGPFTGTLDSSGAISLASTVSDNALVSPAGSKWNITVCPDASVNCTSVVMTVTGGSLNVATTVNASIPVIAVTTQKVWPTAYADGQVTPVFDGAAYFNTTTGVPRAYYQGTWAAFGGGGGGTPGGSNTQLQYNNGGAFGGDTSTTDGAGNIKATSIKITGAFISGTAPTGCPTSAVICSTESASSGTPTATTSWLHWDSGTHLPQISLNGAAEVPMVMAPTSTTTTQALFATATAGKGTYRAITTGDLTGVTRTWRWDYQGVLQGTICSGGLNFPTANAPTWINGSNYSCEWQIPSNSTNNTWFVKFLVPSGVSGSYTYTVIFRSSSTTGSATVQPATLCVPNGNNPDTGSFVTTGISTITLTPAGSTNTDVTATGTFTPHGGCAAGSWLYVQTTFTANTIGAVVNFNYNGIAVQGAL